MASRLHRRPAKQVAGRLLCRPTACFAGRPPASPARRLLRQPPGAGRLAMPSARITSEPDTLAPVRVHDKDSIYHRIDISSADWYHGLYRYSYGLERHTVKS